MKVDLRKNREVQGLTFFVKGAEGLQLVSISPAITHSTVCFLATAVNKDNQIFILWYTREGFFYPAKGDRLPKEGWREGESWTVKEGDQGRVHHLDLAVKVKTSYTFDVVRKITEGAEITVEAYDIDEAIDMVYDISEDEYNKDYDWDSHGLDFVSSDVISESE